MAEDRLLFRFGTITADALLEVKHQRIAKSTEHPLENAAAVTDNRSKKPIEIPVRIFTTDTGNTETRTGRASEVFRQLEEAWSKGTRADMTVGIYVYRDVVLDELSTVEGVQFGSSAFEISAKFLQIRRARTKTVTIQSAGFRDQGRKTPAATETSATAEPVVKTAAKKLGEAIGVFPKK